MPRRRNPARLVIALSVAAVLAVFLVYVAIAGGGMPQLQPGEVKGRTGELVLTGRVVTGSVEPLQGEGVRFRLSDIKGSTTMLVRYPDSPPDQFRDGRDLSVRGQLRGGVFQAEAGSMITKCPSKYVATRTGDAR